MEWPITESLNDLPMFFDRLSNINFPIYLTRHDKRLSSQINMKFPNYRFLQLIGDINAIRRYKRKITFLTKVK